MIIDNVFEIIDVSYISYGLVIGVIVKQIVKNFYRIQVWLYQLYFFYQWVVNIV